jgi:hypothetical protein
MSEGHNDNDEERTEQTNKVEEKGELKPVSYYYDDSTNYETYCEDDDDDPTPTDEAVS